MDIIIFILIVVGSVIFGSKKKIEKMDSMKEKKNFQSEKRNYDYKTVQKKKSTVKNINSKTTKSSRPKNETLKKQVIKADVKQPITEENKDFLELKVEKVTGIGEELLRDPKKAFLLSEIFNRKY